MGILAKLFGGGKVTLDSVRKAVQDNRFADAARLTAELDVSVLSVAEREELDRLKIEAGDGLARLNLGEALGMQYSGKEAQAEEYFQLALEKVCSSALRMEIEAARAVDGSEPVATTQADDPTGCGGCGSNMRVDTDSIAVPEDRDQQLELILTSYPDSLAGRYLAKEPLFQDAFLLAQSGREEEALELWAEVPPAAQDDLYFFELGCLFGRLGDLDKALQLLERALVNNPDLLLAVEAMIPIMMERGHYSRAISKLQDLMDKGVNQHFCHAQLAIVHARQGELEKAAENVRKALTGDSVNPSFLVFAATVLERSGALGEAEDLLKQLPANSCQGGVNLPLAEFLLRQKRELGRILDTFNAACREDPQNPRWQLRVAQTYLARNWKKDGLKLLKKVANDPRLEADLAEEAKLLLDEMMV